MTDDNVSALALLLINLANILISMWNTRKIGAVRNEQKSLAADIKNGNGAPKNFSESQRGLL